MRVLLLVIVTALLIRGQSAAEDPKAMLDRAISLARSGKTADAIRQFQAVIKSGAPAAITGQARLELVRLYEGRSDWANAVEQLEALRKLAPQDAEYAYQLGIAYRNLSRWAIVRMQAAAPGSARVKQIEAEQYAIAGDFVRATKRYQDAVAADPNLPGSHLALAMIYLRTGRRDEALAEIDRELTVSPDSAVAKQMRQALGARGPR